MNHIDNALNLPTGTLDDHLAALQAPVTDAQIADRVAFAIAVAAPVMQQVRDCLPIEEVHLVPWPDHEGCPWLPYGRSGTWLVFEAPSSQRGHARARRYLSVAQVRTGRIDQLEMRDDLLSAWFPGDGPAGWDVGKVATWLHHHADIAERSRLIRYRARLEAAGFKVSEPALTRPPVPAELTLDRSQRPDLGLPRIRTLHLTPQPDGTATLALTICGMGRDRVAPRCRLTVEQVGAIARALPAAGERS